MVPVAPIITGVTFVFHSTCAVFLLYYYYYYYYYYYLLTPGSYPMRGVGSSLGIKRPGREADHSSSAEIRLHSPHCDPGVDSTLNRNEY
jgi:hypothetical protein